MLMCITNRKLCRDNFLERINQITLGKPYAIMLREKDLSMNQYEDLAIKIQAICNKNKVNLIINKNIEVATKLKINTIHLSMAQFRQYQEQTNQFDFVGVSIHSLNEAKEAAQLGASYLIAGHIYATDCKKDVPPRGLSFLKQICENVSIPVWAIGGITKENKDKIKNTGAKGICIMSTAMTYQNPSKLARDFTLSKE